VFGQCHLWISLIANYVLCQKAKKYLVEKNLKIYTFHLKKIRILLFCVAASLSFCVIAFDAWLMWPTSLIDNETEKKAIVNIIANQCLYIGLVFALVLLTGYLSVVQHLSRSRYVVEDLKGDKGERGNQPFLMVPKVIFGDILAILAPIISSQLTNIAQ